MPPKTKSQCQKGKHARKRAVQEDTAPSAAHLNNHEHTASGRKRPHGLLFCCGQGVLDDSVTRWLVIETLERATPEEVLQLAFGAACTFAKWFGPHRPHAPGSR